MDGRAPATTAGQHEVVLYAAGPCEFSEMVRLHLESRGQPYTERDVDLDPAARAELLKLGAGGTPVTVIDGEVVVGFDEESIDELLGFEPYNAPEALDGPRLDDDG
ncbi:MAG: glutaredoxin family protein [Dehalococcoidia bacterium]|nr:glutaredoxin family protein [Dehalococcoidia bacterium]